MCPPQTPSVDRATVTVSEQEIQWALDLEQKVKGGYAPKAEELAGYQGIVKKMVAAECARIAARAKRSDNRSEIPPEKGPSREELEWALSLEKKIQAGYVPNPEEVARYQALAKLKPVTPVPYPP
jgi:hypothetical protein